MMFRLKTWHMFILVLNTNTKRGVGRHTFKELLLRDASKAADMIGISSSNSTTPTVLTVVESTESVHNLVVCTLCSCYPLSILGRSPPWYV